MYFNIPGPDNGFELRHSIRSIHQHFVGESHITVIGDKPSWYKGHHIPLPMYNARRAVSSQRRAFLDTQNKIWTAVNHPEMQDEFVWIMDDVYLLRPTTIEDLKVPRYDPWFRAVRSKEWHRLITATFTALAAKGKPNLQYGTHLPHHLEKAKLLELFRAYDYPRNLYLFEILYGNHFRTDAVPYGGTYKGVQYPQFLRRLLKRPRRNERMTDLVGDASVLNYQAVCYCFEVKSWLEASFQHASKDEV